jgi:hypothetical protein
MGSPRVLHQRPARGWLPCTQQRLVQRCKLVVCWMYIFPASLSAALGHNRRAEQPNLGNFPRGGIPASTDAARSDCRLRCDARDLAGTAQFYYYPFFLPTFPLLHHVPSSSLSLSFPLTLFLPSRSLSLRHVFPHQARSLASPSPSQ